MRRHRLFPSSAVTSGTNLPSITPATAVIIGGVDLTRMPWNPATPAEVRRLFDAFPAPWWLAGGYAIELFAGRSFREHADIDVLLLRRDHLLAQQALAGWEWWAADPPGHLRPWHEGEVLPDAVHDIWCRPGPGEPWHVQLMVDKTDGADWVARPDPSLRRPITSLGWTTPDGLPVLAPEIQLYYKSRNIRPKDEADFDAVLPLLTSAQRHWLLNAIPGPHPWLDRLSNS
ncbi:nucleotidyltransferase domain-containing protein [Amycolatopsis lurida]